MWKSSERLIDIIVCHTDNRANQASGGGEKSCYVSEIPDLAHDADVQARLFGAFASLLSGSSAQRVSHKATHTCHARW